MTLKNLSEGAVWLLQPIGKLGALMLKDLDISSPLTAVEPFGTRGKFFLGDL